MTCTRVSEQGLALIRQYEGFCAAQYLCPAGKPTIGYGHVIRTGEDFSGGITQEQAEILLGQDIASVEDSLVRAVTQPINQHQFDALGVFAYNIGIEAFERSTLLRLLNAGKPVQAAGEFGRWVFAGGQRQDGLARRRAAEAALFMQPD